MKMIFDQPIVYHFACTNQITLYTWDKTKMQIQCLWLGIKLYGWFQKRAHTHTILSGGLMNSVLMDKRKPTNKQEL